MTASATRNRSTPREPSPSRKPENHQPGKQDVKGKRQYELNRLLVQALAVVALSLGEAVALIVFATLAGEAALGNHFALSTWLFAVPTAAVFFLALYFLNTQVLSWEGMKTIAERAGHKPSAAVSKRVFQGYALLVIITAFAASMLYAVWLALTFKITTSLDSWLGIALALIGPILGFIAVKPAQSLFRNLKQWFLSGSLNRDQIARHH